jgi:hypothetical protein
MSPENFNRRGRADGDPGPASLLFAAAAGAGSQAATPPATASEALRIKSRRVD